MINPHEPKIDMVRSGPPLTKGELDIKYSQLGRSLYYFYILRSLTLERHQDIKLTKIDQMRLTYVYFNSYSQVCVPSLSIMYSCILNQITILKNHNYGKLQARLNWSEILVQYFTIGALLQIKFHRQQQPSSESLGFTNPNHLDFTFPYTRHTKLLAIKKLYNSTKWSSFKLKNILECQRN